MVQQVEQVVHSTQGWKFNRRCQGVTSGQLYFQYLPCVEMWIFKVVIGGVLIKKELVIGSSSLK